MGLKFYKPYLGTLSEREKKIRDILAFKNYDVPSWVVPQSDDEVMFATYWQIKEIEKLFENK
jgi:hypothetical protein